MTKDLGNIPATKLLQCLGLQDHQATIFRPNSQCGGNQRRKHPKLLAEIAVVSSSLIGAEGMRSRYLRIKMF